eukprot:6188037-Pyramimonas_sp.AAC.1
MWATGDRLSEILDETRNYDVLLLAGTKSNTPLRGAQALRRWADGRLQYEAPYSEAPYSNNSCGTLVAFGPHFREEDVKQIWGSPELAPGRALAVRVKHGPADLCAVCLYYPPIPSKSRNKKRAGYFQTVKILNSWLDSVLGSLPVRCVPFVYADINDGLGGRMHKGSFQDFESSAVGTSTVEKLPGGAGEGFRELLERHHMFAANTRSRVEMTFFGNHSSSRIDYVCLPRGLLDQVTHCNPLRKLGAKFQPIK